ncbi:MAG: hypothetical protein EBX57_06375 [Betaproteobacteria bacterium]|nr:hypothetical protein [Betaproteobacteria bacterium]NDH44339.1 hypothetical protein [Betaproteobacteria bacterium]
MQHCGGTAAADISAATTTSAAQALQTHASGRSRPDQGTEAAVFQGSFRDDGYAWLLGQW